MDDAVGLYATRSTFEKPTVVLYTKSLGHPEFLLIEPDMKKCRAIPSSHVNTLPLIVSALRGWLASHMQQRGSAGSKKKFINKINLN